MISSLTGLLIQSCPSYRPTPVCPGDSVTFTCSLTTGGLYWFNGNITKGYLSIAATWVLCNILVFSHLNENVEHS